MTFMTRLDVLGDDFPFGFEFLTGTNTGVDFAAFVRNMIDGGFLVAGDFFLVDNAAVHLSVDTAEELLALLAAAGIFLIFLPAYSPELNPCELCFSVIKSYLRTLSNRSQTLASQIMSAMLALTRTKMEGFYRHCITHLGGQV